MFDYKGSTRITILVICLILILLSGGIFFALRYNPGEKKLDEGQTYLLKDDYQLAVSAFERALEKLPESIEARLGLAEAYLALGSPDDAIRVLSEAIEIDPNEDTCLALTRC